MPTTKRSDSAKKLSAAQGRKLAGLGTKSAKIRYLDGLGWSRGEIAAKLDIRYQHVRNVLITPLTGKK